MTAELFNTVWEVPRHMRGVVQGQFYLTGNMIDSQSPWTMERSPYGPLVQFFVAEINPPTLNGPAKVHEGQASWREWQGFITRLRGTSGKVRIVDYFRMRPTYDVKNAIGTSNWSDNLPWADGDTWKTPALPSFVTLDAAASTGDDSVVLRGLPADTEEVLVPGDLMEGRPNGTATSYSNLYEVVHCARTNADGKARVYIQPGLRTGFAAGDMMVLREPTGVFRLADATQGIVSRSMGNVGTLGIKLIEEFQNE